MDNDAMFVSPVTLSSIFHIQTDSSTTDTVSYKPRVFGTDCTYQMEHIQKWYAATQHILGEEYPMIADFMSYFPVYIYATTIRNCRDYLIKRFGSNSYMLNDNHNVTAMLQQFEQVYRHVNPKEQNFSPICVLLTYAWYFERDRYSWSLEICDHSNNKKQLHQQQHRKLSSLQALNSRNSKIVNPQHHITINDAILDYQDAGLPVPQVAFHKPYSPSLTYLAHVSYCFVTQLYYSYIMDLSNTATATSTTLGSWTTAVFSRQQMPSDCLVNSEDNNGMIKYKLNELYPLFRSDLQKYDAPIKDYYQPKRCSPTTSVIISSTTQDGDDGGSGSSGSSSSSSKSTAEEVCMERLQQHFQEYVNELLRHNNNLPPLPLHEYWGRTIQFVNHMAQSSSSNITCGAILK